jgi:hypothetical protein
VSVQRFGLYTPGVKKLPVSTSQGPIRRPVRDDYLLLLLLLLLLLIIYVWYFNEGMKQSDSSGIGSDLYSGGALFESRPGQQSL